MRWHFLFFARGFMFCVCFDSIYSIYQGFRQVWFDWLVNIVGTECIRWILNSSQYCQLSQLLLKALKNEPKYRKRMHMTGCGNTTLNFRFYASEDWKVECEQHSVLKFKEYYIVKKEETREVNHHWSVVLMTLRWEVVLNNFVFRLQNENEKKRKKMGTDQRIKVDKTTTCGLFNWRPGKK